MVAFRFEELHPAVGVEIDGLDLVDRAISKVSSTDAIAAVLDELNVAAKRA